MKEEKKFNNFFDVINAYSTEDSHLLLTDTDKFSRAGNTYLIKSSDMDGFFWFYECDDFVFDIHEFNIYNECFTSSNKDLNSFCKIISTYIVKGSGETFHPYQKLRPDSVFMMNTNKSPAIFILHENTCFLSVELYLKDAFLKKHINFDSTKASNMFVSNQKEISKEIGRIAFDVINCNMDSPAADIFFEAKAIEWLSIILNAYSKKEKDITTKDSEALSCVARYIDDHYTMTIPQKTLEQISMMSGTRLKSSFKKKYEMTITEYTQRRRVSIAEVLLLNTNLSIKDVAEAVGYSSQSRFTEIFKRYTKLLPCDLRQNKEK